MQHRKYNGDNALKYLGYAMLGGLIIILLVQYTLVSFIILIAGICLFIYGSQHNKKKEDNLFNRATELIKEGNDNQATIVLDIYIKENPDNYMAYCNRGFAKARMELFEEAYSDFQKSILIESDHTKNSNAHEGLRMLDTILSEMKEIEAVKNKEQIKDKYVPYRKLINLLLGKYKGATTVNENYFKIVILSEEDFKTEMLFLPQNPALIIHFEVTSQNEGTNKLNWIIQEGENQENIFTKITQEIYDLYMTKYLHWRKPPWEYDSE